jgi:hypothetical protein
MRELELNLLGNNSGNWRWNNLRDNSKRLKATEEELLDALDGELSGEHRFVLGELMDHIEDLERRIILKRAVRS